MKNHIVIGRASLHERIERKNGHHLCKRTTFHGRLACIAWCDMFEQIERVCLMKYEQCHKGYEINARASV